MLLILSTARTKKPFVKNAVVNRMMTRKYLSGILCRYMVTAFLTKGFYLFKENKLFL